MQPTSGDVNPESYGNGNGSEGVVSEVSVKIDPTMQIGQGDVKPNVHVNWPKLPNQQCISVRKKRGRGITEQNDRYAQQR